MDLHRSGPPDSPLARTPTQSGCFPLQRLVSSRRQLQMANLDRQTWLRRSRRRANHSRFHEMRHTAAAFMVDGGADPLQVMRRWGRSDIRTT
jgi:integrase